MILSSAMQLHSLFSKTYSKSCLSHFYKQGSIDTYKKSSLVIVGHSISQTLDRHFLFPLFLNFFITTNTDREIPQVYNILWYGPDRNKQTIRFVVHPYVLYGICSSYLTATNNLCNTDPIECMSCLMSSMCLYITPTRHQHMWLYSVTL